jgi:hypothetical protein
MKTISMLEFRRNSDRVIQSALVGERMLLTYRGKPMFRLEPCVQSEPGCEDPFYRLADHADANAKPLSNREIDRVVYEG